VLGNDGDYRGRIQRLAKGLVQEGLNKEKSERIWGELMYVNARKMFYFVGRVEGGGDRGGRHQFCRAQGASGAT